MYFIHVHTFHFLKLIKCFLVIQWLMFIGWLNQKRSFLAAVINAYSQSKDDSYLFINKLYVMAFAYAATIEIQLFLPPKL